MIKKHLLRLSLVLALGVILSIPLEGIAIPTELPQMLFGVMGILFPVGLAVASSIDLMRVRNRQFRDSFRQMIAQVRRGFVIQFAVSVIAICVAMIFPDKLFPSLGSHPLSTTLLSSLMLGYAILYTIANYNGLQRFKDDLEERIIEEEAER